MGVLVDMARGNNSGNKIDSMNDVASQLLQEAAQDKMLDAQEKSNDITLGCTIGGSVVVAGLVAVAVW